MVVVGRDPSAPAPLPLRLFTALKPTHPPHTSPRFAPGLAGDEEHLLGEDEGDEHVRVLLGVPQLRHKARRPPLPPAPGARGRSARARAAGLTGPTPYVVYPFSAVLVPRLCATRARFHFPRRGMMHWDLRLSRRQARIEKQRRPQRISPWRSAQQHPHSHNRQHQRRTPPSSGWPAKPTWMNLSRSVLVSAGVPPALPPVRAVCASFSRSSASPGTCASPTRPHARHMPRDRSLKRSLALRVRHQPSALSVSVAADKVPVYGFET